MERRTAVQAACVFVATLAAGLPFALQAGQWMAGWPADAPDPVPAQTQYLDAGTDAQPGEKVVPEPGWDELQGEGGGLVPAPGEDSVIPSGSAGPAPVAPAKGKPVVPARPEPTTPAEEPTEPQQTQPPTEPSPPAEEPEEPPASEPPVLPELTPDA